MTPRTEAGRRLVKREWRVNSDDVRAIEDEAEANGVRKERERIDALFPCRDGFPPPATCLTNDGTGLWCPECIVRARIAGAAITDTGEDR